MQHKWKYVLILIVLTISCIYFLPNFYPAAPAIQISHVMSSHNMTNLDIKSAQKQLSHYDIQVKKTIFDKNTLIIVLKNKTLQLTAKNILQRHLGDDYIIALTLAKQTPKWLSHLGGKPMNLGIDLSGGIHFLLEADINKTVETRLRVYDNDLKNRLRQSNIRYRSMPIKNNKITLLFNNKNELYKAKNIITKFKDLYLTTNDINELNISFTEAKIKNIHEYSLNQNLMTIRNRVNELGVSEPIVQRQGFNRIVVELPGIQDTAEAKKILGKTANIEFRLAAEDDSGPVVPSANTEILEFKENVSIMLDRSVIITGDQVTYASAGFDENGYPEVNINLDSSGGYLINRATRNNIGKNMAVILIEQKPFTFYKKLNIDGLGKETKINSFKEKRRIISFAQIQSILGTKFRITGLNTSAEASELALLLRAGSIAAPMYFVEEKIIGPSLGVSNIDKGIKSALFSMMCVSLFMLFLYRILGIIAILALAINLVILIALMSLIGATLTLPGVAGIVLTIGMAVDANVLIFSRIREELINFGLLLKQAIDKGFKRSFTAILDSNITSLLVGVILYVIGTGPIKGFAITMSLGIMTSMFTSLILNRTIVNLIFQKTKIQTRWIWI